MTRLACLVASIIPMIAAAAADAARIYMLSSGDAATDNAAALALTSRGHTVTLGVQYTVFDGTASLANIDTVYLQANANWTGGPMPVAGQQQLVGWVRTGGRLVTSEWVAYFSGGNFAVLADVLPLAIPGGYRGNSTATLTRGFINASLDAGLPTTFTIPLNDYAGTESFCAVKNGASLYYHTDYGTAIGALAGWRIGLGYVYSFNTTCGPSQTADANFGRLFSNAMTGVTPACESLDYNGDGDAGTDADIEAFFACLAGHCCANCPRDADYNGDGDLGTDADIESFFRVLAGGAC